MDGTGDVVGRLMAEFDEAQRRLRIRNKQIERLVTALQSQGLHQHFIDALLDVDTVEGKS